MDQLFQKGKKLFTEPQHTVFSAASVIMFMVILSRILGLIRQRTLANFFPTEELDLFFAAFRLPDLIFEVLVFGTFSSAFIPVFAKAFRKNEREAWETAARVINIGLVIAFVVSVIVAIWAEEIYKQIAPGFSPVEIVKIAMLARVLFIAQAFFVASYILTGALESLKRFLIPALAPIFYNLGIIAGSIIFFERFGLFAPVFGVLIGAAAHFLIQLPTAYKLGFRFSRSITPNDEVKEIGKLAWPRLFDLSFQQVQVTAELYFSSLISSGSYTYFTLANSLQLLPLTLFGVSLAKAALPSLSREEDSPSEFRRILVKTFTQMYFLILPCVALFIALRIPIVRLAFGTGKFSWEDTLQTGMVLLAFAVGVPFKAGVALFSRAFYALHNTKLPVLVSLLGDAIVIGGYIVLISHFRLPAWALAASFSLGAVVEFFILLLLLEKRIAGIITGSVLSVGKSFVAAFSSGLVMYYFLKFFDQYTWIKRLSFVGLFDLDQSISFENFVLDTRYALNLLILTIVTSLLGAVVYFGMAIILRSEEFFYLLSLIFPKKPAEIVTGPETITTPPLTPA